MLHGGLLGGAAAFTVIARATGVNFLTYCDGAALALSLGEAIARVGCHVYGCCWGRPTNGPIGIRYTSKNASVIRHEPHLIDVRLHAVQLYSSLFAMCIFGVLLWQLRAKTFDGMLAATYCVVHPIGRLMQEQLRQDNRGRLWGRWTHTNFYSIIIFACGIYIWFRHAALPNTPLDRQIHWSQIVKNTNVLGWVIPFALIFSFVYGIHYKSVGSWLGLRSTK